MTKLFGTDGIRGVVNVKLTANLAFNLGRAYGVVLSEDAKFKKVLVGRDTRISGQMLESAFVAGLNSMGFTAILPGILPTPAHSYLTKVLDVDGGVMITASHNPAEHNGLKFCDCNGCKLDKEEQERIEQIYNNIDAYLGCEPLEVGHSEFNEDLLKIWVEHIIKTADVPSLNGVKIALDTANGASFAVAPYVFKALGATVLSYNNSNLGTNINKDCGSLHTEEFCKICASNDVFLGLSFDGDADRVMVVDGKGNLFDGSDMMYIFANYLAKKGKLKNNLVVSTIVTNCGLENALNNNQINLLRTQVGGLYVQQEMLKNGALIGGEENGHIMLAEFGVESDGLSSGLFLVKILLEENKSIQELLSGFKRTLTVKSDVAVSDRQKQEVESGALAEIITELEANLGNSGRIIVRTSGTESLVRVLVEGENQEELQRLNDILVDKINKL